MKLKVQKLVPDARLPERAHLSDAGYDLFAAEESSITPGARAQVSTGVALEIPAAHVGLIWDKSGLAHKSGAKVLGGVIDSGYRGEVLVGIVNLGDEVLCIERGQKVAQILIQKYEVPEIVEVEALDEADRGDAGFGSTGK